MSNFILQIQIYQNFINTQKTQQPTEQQQQQQHKQSTLGNIHETRIQSPFVWTKVKDISSFEYSRSHDGSRYSLNFRFVFFLLGTPFFLLFFSFSLFLFFSLNNSIIHRDPFQLRQDHELLRKLPHFQDQTQSQESKLNSRKEEGEELTDRRRGKGRTRARARGEGRGGKKNDSSEETIPTESCGMSDEDIDELYEQLVAKNDLSLLSNGGNCPPNGGQLLVSDEELSSSSSSSSSFSSSQEAISPFGRSPTPSPRSSPPPSPFPQPSPFRFPSPTPFSTGYPNHFGDCSFSFQQPFSLVNCFPLPSPSRTPPNSRPQSSPFFSYK